ncbi:MAG: DUF418 domain-containing protein [Muribaculaceae bacterium]|nr:DUF418 domain-containing protein [Muribaculaceae bacterium]
MTNTVKRHARIDAADVLRGFAVLAIILLHSIEHFNFYDFPDPATRGSGLAMLDRAIWDGLFFAFGGKAYAIFALLFGFSFFIQHDNHRMRGYDFRARFAWRLVLLFLVGQLNAAFFTAEVLVLYALVGFVLIAVCRFSDRVVLTLAAICLLQPIFVWHIIASVVVPGYELPSLGTGAMWQATFAVQSTGTFWETVKVNLWEGQLASLGWAWEHGRVFQTAALFMLGMVIGRRGWFKAEYLPCWGRVLAVALICYFPLNEINAIVPQYVTNPNTLTPLSQLLSSLTNFCFMLVLVSGVLFGYYRTQRVGRWLALLIPYGRLSMTNYVTQGIIGSALFYHWGLYLRLGIAESLCVGIAIFLVQYAACRLWTRRYSHGPLEYLWKKATYIGFRPAAKQ